MSSTLWPKSSTKYDLQAIWWKHAAQSANLEHTPGQSVVRGLGAAFYKGCTFYKVLEYDISNFLNLLPEHKQSNLFAAEILVFKLLQECRRCKAENTVN